MYYPQTTVQSSAVYVQTPEELLCNLAVNLVSVERTRTGRMLFRADLHSENGYGMGMQ